VYLAGLLPSSPVVPGNSGVNRPVPFSLTIAITMKYDVNISNPVTVYLRTSDVSLGSCVKYGVSFFLYLIIKPCSVPPISSGFGAYNDNRIIQTRLLLSPIIYFSTSYQLFCKAIYLAICFICYILKACK